MLFIFFLSIILMSIYAAHDAPQASQKAADDFLPLPHDGQQCRLQCPPLPVPGAPHLPFGDTKPHSLIPLSKNDHVPSNDSFCIIIKETGR